MRQLVPVYYALGDTKTPVIVSAIDLCAFIGLAVGLRGTMGHAGISAAVAGSSAVQMLLLFALLRRKLGGLEVAEVGGSLARTLLASALAGVAAFSLARLLSGAGRLVPGALSLAVFAVVFFVVAWGARSPELEEITGGLRRRLARR